MTDDVKRTDEEWAARLDPEQYRVTRLKGTERPFTGAYHDCTRRGRYRCVCCGAELFRSESKFDSGTGWPSFRQPAPGAAIREEEDRSLWMLRTEVQCGRCDAHLGHVFPDGPAPTGLRYCINSAALSFDEAQQAGDAGSPVGEATGRGPQSQRSSRTSTRPSRTRTARVGTGS